MPASCRCRSPAKYRASTNLPGSMRMSANTSRASCRWRWLRRRKRCAMPVSTPRSSRWTQQREIGVVLGSGGGAQEFSEEQVRLWLTGKVKQVSLFCIPSGTMGTLSSEISMRFGLRGMSHVITTGCTSSTDAFGYALRQIQFGFLPMMLAGGVDAPIAPGIMKGFTLMKIMTTSWNDAPERASRPFSADRDGFVVAEGSWMFVLEEYEHARARGARDPGRSRGLWLDLRGLPSRAAAGVRRRAGARHPDGDGGRRHRRRRR